VCVISMVLVVLTVQHSQQCHEHRHTSLYTSTESKAIQLNPMLVVCLSADPTQGMAWPVEDARPCWVCGLPRSSGGICHTCAKVITGAPDTSTC
jgi:hypothetical protein